jgi:hypothetical protein
MSGKRTLREHRTAAKAWDTARAAGGATSRHGDAAWSTWQKAQAKQSRRRLKAQSSKGEK